MAYTNFTNCTKEQYESIIYSEEDTNRIRIWFNNVELIDADEYCENFSGTNRILPSDGNKVFTLDNFIAKDYTLILRDLPEETIIEDQVRISIGTLVDETNSIYEDVPIGIFNIQDTPTRDNGKITIKLRDNRVKFDFNYNAQPLIESLGGAATKKQILEDICNQAGVINNVLVFDGQDDEVGIYDNTITATTYVSYIFEQAGLMPTINRNGELDKILFEDLKVWRIPLSIVENYELGTPFEVQKVVYESGVVKYESSSEESLQTLYLDAGNPYITNEEQIDNIYNMLNCFSIDSVKTGRILGNPAIDPFDILEVYDDEISNSPVTTETGTTISLEDTVEKQMKIKLEPSQIVQDGTPTPTNPVNVETITGENTINVMGKNMFTSGNDTSTRIGVDATYNGSEILLNGTTTSSGNIFYDETIALNTGYRKSQKLPAGTYTLSSRTTGTATYPSGVGTAFYIRDDNANAIVSFSSLNNYQTTFTLNSETQIYCQMYVNGSGAIYNNYCIYIQIERGSITTPTYEPYKETSTTLNFGKNLFDLNTWSEIGVSTETYGDSWELNGNSAILHNTSGRDLYLVNGVTVNGSTVGQQYRKYYIPCKPNTTYTLSFDKYSENFTTSGADSSYLDVVNENNVVIDFQSLTGGFTERAYKTFTTGATAKYILFRFGVRNSVGSITYANIILQEGTSTNYAPYFTPIEYCKIGNYEDEFIRTTGKNLFENSNMENAYISSTGEYVSSTTNFLYPYTQVNSNKQIALSSSIGVRGLSINEYNSSQAFIKRTQVNTGQNNTTLNTITTDANTKYVRIAINYDNNGISQSKIDASLIQLEYGNTRTTYEPYGKNEWWLKKAIGKVVFDGSENWSQQATSTTGLYRYNLTYNDLKLGYKNALCNYFLMSNETNFGNITTVCFATHPSNHLFAFFSNETSVDNWNAWLENNKPIVYFILDTPTYTIIDNTDLINQLEAIKTIKSQNGQTNIIQETTDLPFQITASAYNNSLIFSTLANNTYTYNGVNRNQFDTQIGLEQRTENVSISSEATLKKWAKTNIDNLQGQITLSAGDISDLEGRVNQTELDISSQGAKIDVLSTNIDEETGNVLGVKTTSYELGSNGFIIDDGTGYKSIDNTTGKYFYDNNSMVGKYTKDGSVQKNLALFGKYYYGVDENVNVETFSKENAMFVAQEYTGQNEQGNDETGFGHFYNGD